MVCDITSRAEIQALAETVIAENGGIDIAVNAAAIGFLAPFEEKTAEQIDSVLATIFKGGLLFMQVMVVPMKRERAPPWRCDHQYLVGRR